MKGLNITNEKISLDSDLIEQFEYIVKKYPEALAIQYQGKSLSYRELNESVNQLARYMQNQGINPSEKRTQTRVGIQGSNKLQIIITIFACMKIGAAWMIIDQDESRERTALIIQDALLDTLIHCDLDEHQALPGCSISEYHASHILQEMRQESIENLNLKMDPEALAYLIATSGSTGKPKILMQNRRNLLAQMKYYSEYIHLEPSDRMLGISPLSHDQGSCNVFSALLNGCGLFIHDLQENNFQNLLDFIRNNKITVYVSVPGIWKPLASLSKSEDLESLRLVRLGGEETSVHHARLYQEKCHENALFVTAYGASECSFMALNTIDKETRLEMLTEIPLGSFLEHVRYDKGEEAGNDFALLISSPYLALGYTRADENEGRFLTREDGRYYLTGDRAEVSEKGVYFRGRESWHEKIQGNRVNLQGIERFLREYLKAGDLESVVLAIGEGDEKKLIACVTGITINADALLAEIKQTGLLPHYAIPFAIKGMDNFPRLHSKKVDRKALKVRVENEFLDTEKAFFSKIRNLEDLMDNMRLIWDKWGNIAFTEAMSDEEIQFRSLGGDSIAAMRLSAVLNRMINACILKNPEEKHVQVLSANDIYSSGSLAFFKKHLAKKIEENQKNTLFDQPFAEDIPFATRNFVCRNVVLDNFRYAEIIYRKSPTLRHINFPAMQQLARHFNKVNSIHMEICRSFDDFMEHLVKNMKEHSLDEMGLIFPISSLEAHRIPCVLSFDIAKKEWGLFISDSADLFEHAITYGLKIKNHPALRDMQLRIYVDPLIRQNDINSCNIDALLYLENALKNGFRKNIYITENSNEGLTQFVSPPACMQGNQRGLLSLIFNMIITLRIDLKKVLTAQQLELLTTWSDNYVKTYLNSCSLYDSVEPPEKVAWYTLSKFLDLWKTLTEKWDFPGDIDSLKSQLLGYLEKTNRELFILLKTSIELVEKNTEKCPGISYDALEGPGILSITILPPEEKLSEKTLETLSPHAIFMQRTDKDIAIYWRNSTGEKAWCQTLLKQSKLSKFLLEQVIKGVNDLGEHARVIEPLIFSEDYCYGKVLEEEHLSMLNTWYSRNSDPCYQIIMYGRQLDNLEFKLSKYLSALSHEKGLLEKTEKNTLFSQKRERLSWLKNITDTLLYLKILFGFEKQANYPHISMNPDSHAAFLWGKTSDKTIQNILMGFIKSCDGDFFFLHKAKIEDLTDIRTLVHLFQKEQTFVAEKNEEMTRKSSDTRTDPACNLF